MERNLAQEKTTTGRGAQWSTAACCSSYEKGRHNAGPVHGEWMLGLLDLYRYDLFIRPFNADSVPKIYLIPDPGLK